MVYGRRNANLVVKDSIIWESRLLPLGSRDAELSATVEHSIVGSEGPLPPGPGNLREDPAFVRKGAFGFTKYTTFRFGGSKGLVITLPDFMQDPGDYRLREGSAAIDAGGGADGIVTDLEGNPRPCGAGIDAGAYELCEATAFRRGDSNGDGLLDVSDGLCVLLSLFVGGGCLGSAGGGSAGGCLESADANDDGKVDCSDPVFTLGWLFLGMTPPPPPGPPPGPCGFDPHPPGLGCESYPGCR